MKTREDPALVIDDLREGPVDVDDGVRILIGPVHRVQREVDEERCILRMSANDPVHLLGLECRGVPGGGR